MAALDFPSSPSTNDLYTANGRTWKFDGTSWIGQTIPVTRSISYVIDGGGAVPATGAWGQISVPVACTVTGWILTADVSGSCVVDIKRSTYSGFATTSSIAGTDKPTLSSVQKNQNLTISAWGSTAIAAGDQIQFYLDSASTLTRINITLNVTVP